jgi:uncharacterized protein (TIGR01777 family)
MTIVVAGGTGFLGSALVGALRAGGHRAIVLTRRPRNADDLAWSPDGDNREWANAVGEADAVVNLAGEGIADQRWTAARKQAIRDSRIRATRALVAAIRSAQRPPRVLLSGSAIGIYGVRDDEAVTEETAPGSDFLASVCREWEAEALEATAATRVVLLRTGVVLSKAGGALPRMALPFRLFAGGRLGTGRQYLSWIHLADWIAMVQWALTEASVLGALNVTAPEPVTNADFTRALARTLRRPALLPAPAFALRAALGEMAEALLLGGQRVLPAKAQRHGFAFDYATVDGALREIYR